MNSKKIWADAIRKAVYSIGLVSIVWLFSGCRKEIPAIRSGVEYVTEGTNPQYIEGFFLVNEGNMGSNKCTIDYFDLNSATLL